MAGLAHRFAYVVAACLLVASPGCLDTSAEGCGGNGHRLSTFEGTLSPEAPNLTVPIEYDGTGDGFVVHAEWTPLEEIWQDMETRLEPNPDATSHVRKVEDDELCEGWGGIPAGSYELTFYLTEERPGEEEHAYTPGRDHRIEGELQTRS